MSPNAEADLGRDWTGEVRFWLQPAYCVRRRRSAKGVADADLDAEAKKRDDRSLETPSPPVVPHWSSTSLLGFQKLEFRRLQQLDPYFGPVMARLEAELNNEDCEKAIALAIRRRQTNLEELDDMRLPSGGFWMPVDESVLSHLEDSLALGPGWHEHEVERGNVIYVAPPRSFDIP